MKDSHKPAGPLGQQHQPGEGKPFTTTERARWSDVDAAGVVYFAAYIRFFEVAETEMFRAAGLCFQTMTEELRLWLVRRQIVCDYFKPVLLDQEVNISAYVAGMGNSSLELGFFVHDGVSGQLAATASFRLVAVDHESFTPTPLPDTVREALQPFTLDHESARLLMGENPHEKAGTHKTVSEQADE